MRFKALGVAALTAFLYGGVWTDFAAALPFNQDMVGNQMITGSVMRPKPPRSIPYGSLETRIESREAANKFENPVKADALSLASGHRLFAQNCSVCHGLYENGQHQKATLAGNMPAIDLTLDTYKAGRTDGQIFSVIHFGSPSTLMPPYGWKLSNNEKWDIVNYIRQFQGVK